MPGMNQRGPRNEGAMTGRGRGVCAREASSGVGVACGRGMRRQFRAGAMSEPMGMENSGLLNRILQLESQLEEIKAQLDDPLEENPG